MHKTKVLITGSNGLVGQALQFEFLQNTQLDIVATSLHENRFLQNEAIQFEILDITNATQVEYVLGMYKPDVIINAAAISQIDFCEENKDLAWEINVQGVQHILRSAEKIKAHVVHLSSDFVFDGYRGMYAENDQANPVSFYGQTKLESEKLVQAYPYKWSIVRTVLVYGNNPNINRNNILTWVYNALQEEKEITVVDDQLRTPTLDRDLASGIRTIVEKQATGLFHISGNEYVSVYEFALKIADVFQLSKAFISPISSLHLNQVGKRPPKTGFNITKANKELGYIPASINDGLLYLKNKMG